jgi:cytochrome P450
VHPPTCFPLERVIPPEGADIGWLSLPGGTVISTMAPLMNMNQEVFGDDVDIFRPERWLNQDPEQLKIMERTFFTVSLPFKLSITLFETWLAFCELTSLLLLLESPLTYFSLAQFGHGARSCIGKNIALLEISKLIPQILRQFKIAWTSSEKDWQLSSFWFCKQSNVILTFMKREGPVTNSGMPVYN